jgi:hypothetical protein
MTRRKVTVEFAKSELPVSDDDVRRRMTLMLELDRADKILSLTIKTRERRLSDAALVFEGVAQIEPTDSQQSNEPTSRPAPCGQPGGPQSAKSRAGWWQRSAAP